MKKKFHVFYEVQVPGKWFSFDMNKWIDDMIPPCSNSKRFYSARKAHTFAKHYKGSVCKYYIKSKKIGYFRKITDYTSDKVNITRDYIID